ncbi:hypothetical protein D3C85_1465430 [compost metagenome]
MRTARAAVHHEKALGLEAAALQQGRHALLERWVVERLELVVQRRNEDRIDHHDQQAIAHP